MRTPIAALLIAVLTASPALAQHPLASTAASASVVPSRPSLAELASAELARQQAAAPPQMRIPPRYLWTGVGLLIGGAGTMLISPVAEEACEEGDFDGIDRDDCDELEVFTLVSGAAIAAAGAIVLLIGSNNREPATNNAVSVGWKRVNWRIRF